MDFSLLETYSDLLLAALAPVLLSIIVFFLGKLPIARKMSYNLKQILIGLSFACLAIVGTEFGIPMNGAVLNVRDAAPVCAGLFFGGPAGIIAGFIGGAERWISVLWNHMEYSRLACSVSTALAGLLAALIRKIMFQERRARPIFALAIGGVIEVIHLTTLLITKVNDAERAFEILKICSVPMIIFNALAVMLTSIVLSILNRDKLYKRMRDVAISEQIQISLLISIIVACFATTTFVYFIATNSAKSECQSYLETTVEDVKNELMFTPEIVLSERRHIGETGFTIIINDEGIVCNLASEYYGMRINELGYRIEDQYRGQFITRDFEGDKYYLIFDEVDTDNGYYRIVASQTVAEAFNQRDNIVLINTFTVLIVFALLFCLICALINEQMVSKLRAVNKGLKKIRNGDLDDKIEVESSLEFTQLSDGINKTVNTLKGYIEREAERIKADLDFAQNIQSSSLPSVFPAFPQFRSFDIHATMCTALEVGGDFYDFYMLDGNRIAFLIADVSGKGIPSAMFMMTAKTLLKSLAETHIPLNEVLSKANDKLCDGNSALMFVTAWMGILDLNTGHLEYVNAGHNPPLIYRNGVGYDYIRVKSGMVLAGLSGVKYKLQTLDLNPGDKIFLYTDGVTEATRSDDALYGEDRLKEFLNKNYATTPNELLTNVKKDIDAFVGDAKQFDDITMLSIFYYGNTED